ncbi:type-1 restriction enzyme R protein [archaeon BMS3Bbin16]|nr:type-1 restriction enzyme R protein [archaeon BMS3Bbin16]
MNKKDLSERDICRMFITPSVVSSGWDSRKQIREEFPFTNGRIIVKGNKFIRGERKRADYILYYKPNFPIAVIEAKDNKHSIGSGLQQAIGYGEVLDVPFVYSSNGDGFIEYDKTGSSDVLEKEISLTEFPSPQELWKRYIDWKGIRDEDENVVLQDYFTDAYSKTPRYYQQIAINRTIEAISKDQNRILLVMATGTGKTFVAFQIIYRLWKAKAKKRILYLADRNVLIDQAKNNDFKSFHDILTKVQHRKVDKSFEIYMALYQGLTGDEEWKNIYKQFSHDFFDLIIVDECHRGSAAEDSAWREILDYFSSATQIGLTATPKETKDVSNIDYFGEPIYTYSLKQGIEDGFLAPYKVIRISLDKDLEGWRPESGRTDKYGKVIPDKEYDIKDYDRDLVLDKRTPVVAKKITEFLKNTGRFSKTIVFCVDIEHAERMARELRNENADLVRENSKYIMKITGDDDIGKKELDNFIDPASKYPVIATTSKLMTTGVDAQTCKLIVLDSNIQSMTEFKQIIGRGTRIREDYGKHTFTIMDFRNVTRLFSDPDFDGEPVQIYEPKEGEPVTPQAPPESEELEEIPETPKKYYVNDVEVSVVKERVQYYGKNGKLITESLKDYTKKRIHKDYSSLNSFLKKWKGAEKKSVILEELMNQGVLLSELREEVGRDFDDFDLICHVAFDQKPLTRRERVVKVRKKDYFTRYGEKARMVIDAMLDKYADEGIENIEDVKVLSVNPFTEFGTPIEIIDAFGGRENYVSAIREIENQLYGAA